MPPGGKPGCTDFARLLLPLLASIVSICLLTGCPSSSHESTAVSTSAPSTRNNCYSLLHQLLDDEKDVSMLHFIKKEHSDAKNLIKKIADASGRSSKVLEQFAKEDPSIRLAEIGLPPGEIATRDSIAATKKEELLGESGDKFELTLLLSQAEALNYGWHLAKIASENEPQPDRAHILAGMSEEMKNLYEEVFAMLLSRGK
jgi:hypothetical protein